MSPSLKRVANMKRRLINAGYSVSIEMNCRQFHRIKVEYKGNEVGISGISFTNLDDKQIYKNVVMRLGQPQKGRKR